MDTKEQVAGVLVAIDGRPSSWDALEWAAAEAAAAEQPLRIVHVLTGPSLAEVCAPFPEVRAAVNRGGVESLLLDAERRAHQVASGLSVETWLGVDGSPRRAILRAAKRASLIVLGRGHNRRAARWLFGSSVASFVSRRARCPVVIVGLENHAAGPSAGRIAVLVDDVSPSFGALALAFRAAARRGIGVTVLRPSAGRPSGGLHRSVLLDACQQEFRVSDVTVQYLSGPVGPALQEAAIGAALFVIGTQEPSRLHRARIPTDAKTVAKLARTPVLIVPALPGV